MYSKTVEIRYFPGTNEAVVIIDGVAHRVCKSIQAALKEGSAELAREVIRRERTNDSSDSSR